MLLGLLFVLAVGVWPAAATVDSSYTKVTSPANGSVLAGHYDSSDNPVGFDQAIRGQAKTNCSFRSIVFSISGPNSYSKTFPSISPSGTQWSGGPSTTWDTQPLVNGVYSVRMTVNDTSGLLCNSNTTYVAKADVKLANAPATPQWTSAPSAASDGSPHVSFAWKKNAEDDILSYEITRSGPDGSHTALVGPSVCSGSTCSVEDTSFPADYSGSYSYSIVAVRSAPSGTGDTCGSDACVRSSSSDVKSATLTKPSPTPSPSPSGSPTDSPTPTPGGGGGAGGSGGTGGKGKDGGTRVLSFGGGGSGSGYNEFYTGTYKEQLPYQSQNFILGSGQTTPPADRQVEAAAVSDAPPNFRTIMLPVAGGLLAFLSAAHVRRLLIHF
jgi:hypothetical protein